MVGRDAGAAVIRVYEKGLSDHVVVLVEGSPGMAANDRAGAVCIEWRRRRVEGRGAW